MTVRDEIRAGLVAIAAQNDPTYPERPGPNSEAATRLLDDVDGIDAVLLDRLGAIQVAGVPGPEAFIDMLEEYWIPTEATLATLIGDFIAANP